MAVFDESTLNDDWQIWQLLRYGPVTLFHKPEVLNETIQHLHRQQYLVYEFDCQNYEDEQKILNDIASRLGVLQDYGLNPNLDGFNDYLRDVKVPSESGLVIVLHHFDTFHVKFPDCAHSVLDIITHHYHQNLLFGLRFFTLVQTDNPNIQFEPMGAFAAWWNDKEWLVKNRTP